MPWSLALGKGVKMIADRHRGLIDCGTLEQFHEVLRRLNTMIAQQPTYDSLFARSQVWRGMYHCACKTPHYLYLAISDLNWAHDLIATQN